MSRADPIGYEFRKLVAKLKMHRKDVTTFYSLRQTFETIGATAGDQVTDHVHAWLRGTITL